MKLVVVGGHTRNIGKTAVAAGLIRNLRSLNWTAVRITQYGHGICSVDGEPCGCEPEDHAFVLIEEDQGEGRSDTSRFLAAGARRSLWLRVREGQLAEALPTLRRAWSDGDCIVIESNSILEFLKPELCLFVLDSSFRDFKASARRYLDRADALVPIDSRLDARAWPGLTPRALETKPVFPVPAGEFFSPELWGLVRERLGVAA